MFVRVGRDRKDAHEEDDDDHGIQHLRHVVRHVVQQVMRQAMCYRKPSHAHEHSQTRQTSSRNRQ